MKKNFYIFGTAFLLCINFFLLTGFQKKPVLFVNGDRIYEEEYLFLSQVYTGGMAEEEKGTRNRAACAKVEQQMLKENNVVEDISFSSFLNKVNQENEARKKAMDAGERIYGPKEYDARIYYDYIYSEAKEKMIKNVLMSQITDQEIKSFGEKNGIDLREKEEVQLIRYQLARDRYIVQLKDRVLKAMIKADGKFYQVS